MLEELERLLHDIAVLHSKLILLTGPLQTGKTALLAELAKRHGAVPLNLGSELSRRLAMFAQKHRSLQASNILRELADQYTHEGLLFIDNVEVCFEPSLQLDPLDLLKRQAKARKIVAAWPGEQHGERLIRAFKVGLSSGKKAIF